MAYIQSPERITIECLQAALQEASAQRDEFLAQVQRLKSELTEIRGEVDRLVKRFTEENRKLFAERDALQVDVARLREQVAARDAGDA